MMERRIFPILLDYRFRERADAMRGAGHCALVIGIPWGLIAPHEKQAVKNHSQTLERLAQRGGLGWVEALAVLQGHDQFDMRVTEIEANAELGRLLVEAGASAALADSREDR